MENKFIERTLYHDFLRNMPLICCDLLIWSKGKYLLMRRNNEPAKGSLWFPGGRMRKGETPEETCIRVASEEAGLNDCVVRKFLGVYNTIFPSGPEKIPVHSVNLTYFVHSHSDIVTLDSQHSEYMWIPQGNCPHDLDPKLTDFVQQVFLEQ